MERNNTISFTKNCEGLIIYDKNTEANVKYILASLLILILGYNSVSNAATIIDKFIRRDSVTSGLGADINMSNPIMVRVPLVYEYLYDLPISPIEIELDMMILSITQNSDRVHFAVGNALMLAFCGCYHIIVGNDGSLRGNLIDLITLGPQLFGNFKIHLPIIKDGVHVYIGEATDYYVGYRKLITVYTESKAGVRAFIGPVAVDCSINKPWLKGFLKSDKAYIGTHVSWYWSRKKNREIKIKEEEKKNERLRKELDEYKSIKDQILDSTNVD